MSTNHHGVNTLLCSAHELSALVHKLVYIDLHVTNILAFLITRHRGYDKRDSKLRQEDQPKTHPSPSKSPPRSVSKSPGEDKESSSGHNK